MRCHWIVCGLIALLASQVAWGEDSSSRSVKGGIVTVELEEPYSQVCAGGSGRYLIFQLKKARKLVLFDIEKAAVINAMESPSDDVIIAASSEKMVVVVPGTKLIHRYNLPDLKRDKTVAWTNEVAASIVLMGCASNGPLILWGTGPVVLWDLETFKPLPVRGDLPSGDQGYGRLGMTVSADGQTFCAWNAASSPTPYSAYLLSRNTITRKDSESREGYGSWMKPNANGSLFILGGGELCDHNLKRIASANFKDLAMQPTEDFRYFLAVSFRDKTRGEQIWICSTRSLEKLVAIDDVGSLRFNSSGGYDGYFGNESRMRFLPKQGLMATLPEGDKQIRVIPVDMPALLKERTGEYVHIVSVPPRAAFVGQPFSYQLETLSNASSITFTVETGPTGMKVDKDGKITWLPRERTRGGAEDVVISARTNSGKEVFQSFTLSVERSDLGPAVVESEKAAPADPSEPKRSQNQRRTTTSRTARTAKPPASPNREHSPPAETQADKGTVPGDEFFLRTQKDDVVTVDFDEPYSQVCAAGGGRYLIFQLKQAKKLLLFDIVEGHVIKTMPTPADDVIISACADKMILVVPGMKLIHRYSLPDWKREKTTIWKNEAVPYIAMMGCASHGPLALCGSGTFELWSLDTLEPLRLRGALPSGITNDQGRLGMSVSADGQTFCAWATGGSPKTYYAYRLSGDLLSRIESPPKSGVDTSTKPNANASLFLINGELSDDRMKPIAAGNFDKLAIQPTEDPRYFLGATYADQSGGEQIWICTTGSLEKVVSVRGGGSIRFESAGGYDGYFHNESRMRFLPEAGVLATLPKGDKQIRVIPADLPTLLKEKEGQYLHLISVPPRTAVVGIRLTYQIEALSNLSPVVFSLENGPDGMTVDKQGKLEWSPKVRPKGGTEDVVVAVRARDKEVFQSFTLSIERADARMPVADADKPSSKASSRPNSRLTGGNRPTRAPDEPRASNDKDASSTKRVGEGQPVPVDERTLELQNGEYRLGAGLRNRSMLLLQRDQLTVLEADGITIKKTHNLPKTYLRIAEREDYWVGVTEQPIAVEILSKDSFAVQRSVKLTAMELTDSAFHPSLPVAYVACKVSVDIPRKRFFVIDEAKGEAHESEEYIGTWLQVDPAGRFLVAGYSDIYERGANLLMNPDRWHIVPDYGNLDFVIRYDLDREGQPTFGGVKPEAGGNGRGLRLSADGKRVTYLSVVGSPPFSGNLAGWDPMDLNKVPAIYATKDKASTEHLAYHPFLPLVATIKADQAPVLFNRETGDEDTNHLDWPADEFAGAKLQDVYFSPAGKHLILGTQVNDVRYLQAVALKLNAEELRENSKAARALSGDASAPAASKESPKVPLRLLDALAGRPGKEMSAREIGQEFMSSVVVVQSDSESGSGFIVGSSGYVVTCEHCLPPRGDVRVVYRPRVIAGAPPKTATATVIKTDRSRDLALIKIAAGTLQPVRFESSNGVESGAKVTAIGNPGVAKTILDFTMTDGIISSPKREIAGRTFIQTSATFNRGSSGGPLFDDHGCVIGMIAAKANIEATGFAIPASEIVAFLVNAADKSEKNIGVQRLWRDASDRFSVDAKLVAVTPDSVKLDAADGREITVEKKKLSRLDQELLELIGSTVK